MARHSGANRHAFVYSYNYNYNYDYDYDYNYNNDDAYVSLCCRRRKSDSRSTYCLAQMMGNIN